MCRCGGRGDVGGDRLQRWRRRRAHDHGLVDRAATTTEATTTTAAPTTPPPTTTAPTPTTAPPTVPPTTPAPVTTAPLDPIADLAAAIERDLNLGEQTSFAGADPAAANVQRLAEQYFTGGP